VSANRPVVGLAGARFGGVAGRRCRATVDPPDTDDAVAASDHRGDQVVGLNGAWLPAAFIRGGHRAGCSASERLTNWRGGPAR
jgi:hypothetical protein